MFNRFMELTFPYWLTASALLPVIVAVYLIRAAIRIRQLRSLLNDATRRAAESGSGLSEPHPWQTTESTDWAAQR